MTTTKKEKAPGFKVEKHDFATLDALFPHQPQDASASVAQLLEARATDGWALVKEEYDKEQVFRFGASTRF